MKLSQTMIALLLAGAGLSAQTTGFPFFNDYTINGSVSGSTSCTNVTIVLPSLLSFDVQTAGPGRTV
ncbi:MAG: hypothetical protein KDB53_02610, partial [Planctomycetes bacterium]|nr:hypothetical protein [Planctomycetota bacterium]